MIFLNVNVYWSRKLLEKVKIKMSIENGSEPTLKDVMLILASIKRRLMKLTTGSAGWKKDYTKWKKNFAKWEI